MDIRVAGADGWLGRGEDWSDFVDRLPALTAALLHGWELRPDGEAFSDWCSLIQPVRTTSGRPAMLKVGFPDDESEHEHLALQHWQGNGAVTLLRADPRRRVMLLERLHREDLTGLSDLAACEVVAGIYQRLHVPALPQLKTLTSYVDRWSEDLGRLPRNAPIPRRLVERVLSLTRDLLADDTSTGTMIHADLHYENVLAGDREPWLAIDPKPVSGDPHYEPAPMLWTRFDELAGNVRDGLRRRFHTLVDAAGLDEDRARDWVVVRTVVNAMWTVRDAAAESRGLVSEERDWITRCVTIAKAVQD